MLPPSTATSRRPARAQQAGSGSIPPEEAMAKPLLKPVNTLGWTPKEKKITTLARKSWNVLLHEAQNQGLDKETFSTTLSKIVKNIDYGSNDLELIKKHLRSMVSTTVEWQSPTSGEGAYWTVCGLLAHAKLSKVRGEVWVEWSYAINMRQELLEPRVFARLQLPILSQLRTHAGLALYEICTRYKDVGRTARQSWHWWRPVLSGRPETEKTAKMEYRIFKRDCLRLAVAEVCAVTDIDVELVEHKAGRFISELQFLVKAKPASSAAAPGQPPEPVDLALISRAQRLGVDSDRAEALQREHGETALRSGLDALEKRIVHAYPEPVRDAHRYLKALMPGEVRKAAVAQDQAAEAERLAPAAGAESRKRRQAAWTDAWLKERRQQVVQDIAGCSPEVQAELVDSLLRDMEERNVHPSIRKRLVNSGWQHQMVVGEMVRFYAQRSFGEGWDQPSTDDLLDIAARGEVLDA